MARGTARCRGVGGLIIGLCLAATVRAQSPYAHRTDTELQLSPVFTSPFQDTESQPSPLFSRPLDSPALAGTESPLPPTPEELLRLPVDPPLGYTGPSGI